MIFSCDRRNFYEITFELCSNQDKKGKFKARYDESNKFLIIGKQVVKLDMRIQKNSLVVGVT